MWCVQKVHIKGRNTHVVVDTVGEAVDDVPSEADAGPVAVLAGVVPEAPVGGATVVDVRIVLGTTVVLYQYTSA